MKKTTKNTKMIKAIMGLGTLLAFALPASIAPAIAYDPGMPVPPGIRTEAEMEGGLNYKHNEDDLLYKHYTESQGVNSSYQQYSDYGRKGNPNAQGGVVDDRPGSGYMQGAINQADNQSVYVNSIEVSPSQILSREEVNTIIQPLIAKNVYISDLKAAVEQINRLYANKGFVTARAFLPEQAVDNGHIRIELVESKVGNVTVEQNRWTTDNFIKKRIHPKEGELFDIVELERDIMDFNRYNEGVNLTANLKAGQKEGTTDIELTAHERFPFHITAMMDNAGRYTTGRIRGGTMLSADSLFHQRDKLSLGTYFSGGSVSPFADYNIPVNSKDGRVGFMFSSTFSKVKWGPYKDLDLKSRAYTYSLYYTQPLIRKPGFELKSYTAASYKRALTEMGLLKELGTDTRISTDDIMSFDLALNMRKDTRYGIWYLNQGGSYNINMRRGDNYFKIYGGAVRLHDFSHGIIGQLRGNYQIVPGMGHRSDRRYVPYIDQFQAGGMATVRGYAEGAMIGKNGFFTSAELMFPLMPRQITSPRSGEKIPFIGKYIKGAVFADFGGVFPQVGEYQYAYDAGFGKSTSYFMASIGMGLRVQLPFDLTGRLYWGYPLINSQYLDRDRKVGRFHFELTMEPNFDALLRRRYVAPKAQPQPAPPKPQPAPAQPVNNYDDIRHYDYFNDGAGGTL
ncbi:MAG: POTRA domain-containing protein [Candidatus Gastranaerophilaceae bacterium]|nr:POTRA domain-containing protein [Candidatus Gastranaerophilaceae bacterium]